MRRKLEQCAAHVISKQPARGPRSVCSAVLSVRTTTVRIRCVNAYALDCVSCVLISSRADLSHRTHTKCCDFYALNKLSLLSLVACARLVIVTAASGAHRAREHRSVVTVGTLDVCAIAVAVAAAVAPKPRFSAKPGRLVVVVVVAPTAYISLGKANISRTREIDKQRDWLEYSTQTQIFSRRACAGGLSRCNGTQPQMYVCLFVLSLSVGHVTLFCGGGECGSRGKRTTAHRRSALFKVHAWRMRRQTAATAKRLLLNVLIQSVKCHASGHLMWTHTYNHCVLVWVW